MEVRRIGLIAKQGRHQERGTNPGLPGGMPARLSRASRRVLTQVLPAALATLPIHGQVLETVAAGSGAIPRRQTVGGPLWQHAHRWPTTNQDRKYRRIDRVANRPSLLHGAAQTSRADCSADSVATRLCRAGSTANEQAKGVPLK